MNCTQKNAPLVILKWKSLLGIIGFLLNDVKRNTKIEGMGPTNPTPNY